MTMRRSLAATLGLALLLAACGAAPGPVPTPSTSPTASRPADHDPTPVPLPSQPDNAGGGTGGGSAPGQGGGVVPVDPGTGGGTGPGGIDGGQATPVKPVAGAIGIHDVGATGLRAAVDGRRISVELTWWSGVEPCNVLAAVDVVRDGSTFTITIREGSVAGPDVACIEIAMLKATIVDLGEVDPGTYTIRAFGDAAPVEVAIAG